MNRFAAERYYAETRRPGPLCPHPFKLAYPTTDAARVVAATLAPDDPTLDAYRCRCGSIHLGHSIANNRPKETP